jgi:cytochrome c-type biogenesis protein CcmH
MKRLLAWLAALVVVMAPAIAFAADATPTELDPVAAKRAVELSSQLRCLVCQNQTIAESNAELAVDLRRQVNEQIKAGKTDKEIVDYMVERYGAFVLYKPPFNAVTVLLWLGPGLLAVLAIVVFVRTVRARNRAIVQRPLSDAERAEAERLLGIGAFDGGIVPKLRAAAIAAGRGVSSHIGRTAVVA